MAEKKITRVDGTPVEPAGEKTEKPAAKTKTEEMAEKIAAEKAGKKAAEAPAEENTEKKPAAKKVRKADGTEASVKPAAPAKDAGSATGLRIGAVALWVVGIVLEVLAILMIVGKITITFMPTLALIIIALVLDLACVSGGSLLWKKANRIDPASKANKVKYWLWNNMGLIAAVVAFLPFIIISLSNKNADKKTKTIATIVAVIALLISGLVGYDWNPISAEEKEAAVETLADTDVYWTTFGKVYHTSTECSHLNHSDALTVGTVEQAIENNRTRLCKDCAKRDNIVIDADAQKADTEGLNVLDDTDDLTAGQDDADDELVIEDNDDPTVEDSDELVIEDDEPVSVDDAA